MKLHFYGAAQTVTGSRFLLEVNGKRLLVDCGMYQGKRSETYSQNQHFHFDPRSVDAVLLTHSHIDHSGNLPNLVKQGFHGPIYATAATCDLADLMLQDSGHIQEADAEFVNKRRGRDGLPPIEPLYTREDATRVARSFRPRDYNVPFKVMDGITAKLVDSGHVLGSSSILIEAEENGRTVRLWFSGDIGRRKLHILRDPVLPESADYLIMESTYGDKVHSDPQLAYDEFCDMINETIRKRGKVIVPAFAVGRTQELIYAINESISHGKMPPIPVYIDSPLAVNASDVFRRHPECYDEETRRFLVDHRHPALDFKGLTYIRSVEESKALNDKDGPMVILSASGMAESGRILHHLKNNIEDARNMILIVSWQAPDTLGRRLADRAEMVRIFGEEYIRRAGVTTIGGLSGHAGQDMLVEYAKTSRSTLKKIFLTHGEPPSTEALKLRLLKEGISQLEYPSLDDVFEL